MVASFISQTVRKTKYFAITRGLDVRVGQIAVHFIHFELSAERRQTWDQDSPIAHRWPMQSAPARSRRS
jgi:hypothetical protein